MFVPPPDSIVHKTEFWQLTHNGSARVEGYLMLGSTEDGVYEFSDLSPGTLSEFGHIVALATQAIRQCFQPKHVFVGRYGCALGFQLHLHIVPVYSWLEERILNDSRYDFLGELAEGTHGLRFDAADYLLYTWRELVERGDQSGLPEIDLRKVVGKLRHQIESQKNKTSDPQDVPIDRNHQLQSARCVLRHVSEEDIPEVFAATRFKGFNDGMTWDPPKDEAALFDPYRKNIEAWRAGTEYVFTIESHSGVLIGRISIGRTDTDGLWNIGFWTHPEHQGKGYMTEALRRVLEFGFEELGADEIDAQCATWNTASRRVMEKCGMLWREQLEQGFKKGGAWVQVDRMALGSDGWERKSR